MASWLVLPTRYVKVANNFSTIYDCCIIKKYQKMDYLSKEGGLHYATFKAGIAERDFGDLLDKEMEHLRHVFAEDDAVLEDQIRGKKRSREEIIGTDTPPLK